MHILAARSNNCILIITTLNALLCNDVPSMLTIERSVGVSILLAYWQALLVTMIGHNNVILPASHILVNQVKDVFIKRVGLTAAVLRKHLYSCHCTSRDREMSLDSGICIDKQIRRQSKLLQFSQKRFISNRHRVLNTSRKWLCLEG